MKTLLTTDGSVYARTALLTASQLLTRTDNTFDVACIIPEFSLPAVAARRAGVGSGYRPKYQERIRRHTDTVLKDAKQILKQQGIDARVFAQMGSPAEELLRLAEDYDAVAVGTQSGMDRPSPGLGPVATQIVEHASGIVLIGRRLLNERNFRILLAVDGSAPSENAVDALLTSFQIEGAEITVMHVVEKPWLRLSLEQEWYTELERSYAESHEEPEAERLLGKELWTEARQIVDDVRTRLARRELGTESRIVEGSPASELLDEAETGSYDLAILGATGVSDLKHTLLGSVSFKLASYAPCSVAVVR